MKGNGIDLTFGKNLRTEEMIAISKINDGNILSQKDISILLKTNEYEYFSMLENRQISVQELNHIHECLMCESKKYGLRDRKILQISSTTRSKIGISVQIATAIILGYKGVPTVRNIKCYNANIYKSILKRLGIKYSKTLEQSIDDLNNMGFTFIDYQNESIQKFKDNIYCFFKEETAYDCIDIFLIPFKVNKHVVFSQSLKNTNKISRMLMNSGSKYMVITPSNGMDGISVEQTNHIIHPNLNSISMNYFGLPNFDMMDITSTDIEDCVSIIMECLIGQKSLFRDTVLCNVSMMMDFCGQSNNVRDTMYEIKEDLKSRKIEKWIQNIIESE